MLLVALFLCLGFQTSLYCIFHALTLPPAMPALLYTLPLDRHDSLLTAQTPFYSTAPDILSTLILLLSETWIMALLAKSTGVK